RWRGARRGPRRGPPRSRPVAGDLRDPQGMAARIAEYLEGLQVGQYSEQTLEARRKDPGYFLARCSDGGLGQPGGVPPAVREGYRHGLYHYRKRDGHPMSGRGQKDRLVPVRAWFKWLARQRHILYNPASELELPRVEERLPKQILSA